jgi:hypothetical protein
LAGDPVSTPFGRGRRINGLNDLERLMVTVPFTLTGWVVTLSTSLQLAARVNFERCMAFSFD